MKELKELPCCKSFKERLGSGVSRYVFVPKCGCGRCEFGKTNRLWVIWKPKATPAAHVIGSLHPYEGQKFASMFGCSLFSFS